MCGLFSSQNFRAAARVFVFSILFLLGMNVCPSWASSVIVDFEDLSLASESSWNGSDKSGVLTSATGVFGSYKQYAGGFTSQGVAFGNTYTIYDAYPDMPSWDGWAYSNIFNVTNSSYTNDLSAYIIGASAGSVGAEGSENYAIGYTGTTNPTIALPDGMKADSIAVANTTYAALVMKDGNTYSSPFEDSDSFVLTIAGLDASGSTVASKTVSLAVGKIIAQDWIKVDLSDFASAKSLRFSLDSTDSVTYGGVKYMNTPAYFAIDNLTLSTVPEPSVLAIVVLGLPTALYFWKRRR